MGSQCLSGLLVRIPSVIEVREADAIKLVDVVVDDEEHPATPLSEILLGRALAHLVHDRNKSEVWVWSDLVPGLTVPDICIW